MKSKHLHYLLLLTVANIFISTSGALGKFIDLPTPVLVWWRSIIAFIVLYFYCRYKKISLKINHKQDWKTFTLSAVFMGAHWITYFYALKLSNVALGMLSLYTYPVMVALLEPLFSKTKIDPIHILLGILVFLGIYILAPEFDIENSYIKGILLGLLSALCYALRTLIIKQHVGSYNGTMLMLYQIFILSIVLAPTLFLFDSSNITTQYPYVILLGVLTTAMGHTMLLHTLKYFKVSTASIISSMLPIYGIIIAFFFLGEVPGLNTVIGGILILSTVVIESIRSKKT